MEDLRDPVAFGRLYREQAPALTAFMLRRTGDADMAADLVAETFAAALAGARRYDAARGTPTAWLYGIARNQLLVAQRRGRVEDRARRRLGMERLELTDAAAERLEALASDSATVVALEEALGALPAEQRFAVEARVVEGRDYAEIAAITASAEPTVRQRVSRALARLRAGLSKEGTP